MTKCECKDCTKRKVGCHDKCKSYLAFKKDIERLKQIRKEQLGQNDSAYFRDGWQFRRKK